MKPKEIRLAKQYATALHRYLNQGGPKDLQVALRCGRSAVELRLETLDLARIHEETLNQLGVGNATPETVKKAEQFFTEAITPIVESHLAARERKLQLKRQGDLLRKRTSELETANRQLGQGILRRKRIEEALKKNGNHYALLLKESIQLQEGLRRLTRQVLAAQEDERKKVSRELQNQIAQTLLGINIRLHSLKKEAGFSLKDLKRDISSTQQLVARSARSVQRVAREFGNP